MKILKKIFILTIATAIFIGCTKVEVGFLSDKLFYRANPFVAEQGVVTYSAPIETDGSTAPLNVTLLDIRNKQTGLSVKDSLLKEREVTTFKGEITAADTSLAMINAKLTKTFVKPFNINKIGGRIELSAATRYITAGTYVVDVEVENVKGKRVLLNACEVHLKSPTTAYNFIYKAWTVSTIGAEVFSAAPSDPNFSIAWDPTGPNKIILKWVDKNGTPFNPKANEIIRRGDRPTFADWSPYYSEVKTDSTIVYQYPETGLTFPLVKSVVIAGGTSWSDGICYYRVAGAATSINMNINTVHTVHYFKSGTYFLTFNLTNTLHK